MEQKILNIEIHQETIPVENQIGILTYKNIDEVLPDGSTRPLSSYTSFWLKPKEDKKEGVA